MNLRHNFNRNNFNLYHADALQTSVKWLQNRPITYTYKLLGLDYAVNVFSALIENVVMPVPKPPINYKHNPFRVSNVSVALRNAEHVA